MTDLDNFTKLIQDDISDDTVTFTYQKELENIKKDVGAIKAQILTKADVSAIPIRMSDLTDSNRFVSDANYNHTDNNFSNTCKADYDSAVSNSHTHSNKAALNSLSGTNTGDETSSTIKSKLGITILSGSNTGDQDLSSLVTKTTTINGHALSSNITVSATDVGAPTILSSSVAPTFTPSKIGDICVDTTHAKTYVAKDTSSSADWILQASSVIETRHYVGTTGEPAFQNSWINYAGQDNHNVSFWKDNFGVLHLEGQAKSGTLSSAMFTLPTGYVPSKTQYFLCYPSGNYVKVDMNGTVTPYGSSNTLFVLDGITLRLN